MEARVAAFSDGPFVAGDDVTIADLVVFNFASGLLSDLGDMVGHDVFEDYPRLLQSFQRVLSIPQVVQWHIKHPIPGVSL